MTNYEKGARGERLVSLALEDAFPDSERFDDLIVPAINGLTQIDHILISKAGVFVIEVKKYKGDILGSADAASWVQRIGCYRCAFQNPIWQNTRHVAALQWQLKLQSDQLLPVVVFVGRAEIVRPIAPNVITTSAAGCGGLVRYIKSFSEERLTSAQVNRALKRLCQIHAAGYTRDDLLRSIRERKSRCTSHQSSEIPQAATRPREEAGMQKHSFAWNRLSPQPRTNRHQSAVPPSTEFAIRYPYFRLLRWTPSVRP